MGVGEWLRNLGLGQYEPAFVESAVDFDVLPELTEDDLEKLGVRLGDRKRLIRAIKATWSERAILPLLRSPAKYKSGRTITPPLVARNAVT